MQLRTSVGVVTLTVRHGTDPASGRWGCPIRLRWGLRPHQQCSPVLEDKLAFTVTATGTFVQAAAVATKWGCATDDSTVHALTQRLGACAEAQTQQRLTQPPVDTQPQRAASELGVLLIDGWQVRQRGPGWGMQRPKKPRVEWHELKTGVFYQHEQAAHTAGGRGLLAEKVVLSWQGEPLELGRRLHAEALRHGLGRARNTLVLGDGAAWIWNTAADRWRGAIEVLDFYHASQHIWELGRAVVHGDEPQVAAWVKLRLHRLRHGQERAVLKQIATLRLPRGERGAVVRREQGYFAGHETRTHYERVAVRDWPIGSGAVESACRQRQCRCKRPGQFWTATGLRHLCALEEARANSHWDQLWLNG
jgi:hypothetical protein